MFRLHINNVQASRQGGAGGAVTLSPADLANAIALRDFAMVRPCARRRQEVAERIVTELKSKAPAYPARHGHIGLKQSGRGLGARAVADAVRPSPISAIRATTPPMGARR